MIPDNFRQSVDHAIVLLMARDSSLTSRLGLLCLLLTTINKNHITYLPMYTVAKVNNSSNQHIITNDEIPIIKITMINPHTKFLILFPPY